MSADIVFEIGDDLGPAKVVHVGEASLGLRGILVVDNVAAGPAIGGLRMAPDVDLRECTRLARAMTLKNAAAGLRHGGGKSVLVGDPAMPVADKERLIRAFAHALRHERDYIFGPDMGTNETCMGWILDEVGRAVGLPRALGGIPLDEIGATGWGVFHAAQIGAGNLGIELSGAKFAVQGFGAVGRHAARFLTEAGAIMVAASDSRATLHKPSGLDAAELIRRAESGAKLADSPDLAAEVLARDDIVRTRCDIWIPAARPDVVDMANVELLDTRLVVQGANIPITEEAEQWLHDRGVLVIPDFIANAGGVICAAIEHAGSTQSAAFAAIEERIRANTENILALSSTRVITPRAAAREFAAARVKDAMSVRRYRTM